MEKKSLYHTEIENRAGLNGYVRSLNGGKFEQLTSSPLKTVPGSNPEQLIGAALATCLNATLEAEEKRRGLSHQAVVRVAIDLGRDYQGFQFWLRAQVKLPQVERQTAQEMLAICERRCPVAKLLASSPNVTVELVDDFSLGEAIK
ncbi:OsmC family protein [Liquorilactobacillus nagelii]|uniref:OsmC family protein n=1 Tax=Liquorilactobacillus nagelii TaxID=82688 RepID=UPI0006F102E9|nr:OsmC family protein [Liquorilactobacillus nagelii]KRL41665.1 OsmC Ohr family protein [Liquorilactobacillus nagelii DSM 13675]QYH55153.1 OsmC family protein [Liquorilactobacillus nagelii DSM 13675]